VVLPGGGEYGEDWHQAGMGIHKQAVFDHYIRAAETLVREKVTAPDFLIARGQSNGGLLVGAAVTQRPDLFRAALMRVPLLDMVRFPLFGAGKLWVAEFGSTDRIEEFNALLSYSPYHHIQAGTRYPATLVTGSDTDDRVDGMHARKFVAAMQSATTGGPALLSITKQAGHMGANSVQALVDSEADDYSFALSQIQRTEGDCK
jgi:prolyl oligopeptidase